LGRSRLMLTAFDSRSESDRLEEAGKQHVAAPHLQAVGKIIPRKPTT
jgi:hypothetical protein